MQGTVISDPNLVNHPSMWPPSCREAPNGWPRGKLSRTRHTTICIGYALQWQQHQRPSVPVARPPSHLRRGGPAAKCTQANHGRAGYLVWQDASSRKANVTSVDCVGAATSDWMDLHILAARNSSTNKYRLLDFSMPKPSSHYQGMPPKQANTSWYSHGRSKPSANWSV